MKENKLLKKADIIVIITVIAVFIGFLIYKSTADNNLVANVYVDNKLVNSIDLNQVEKPYDITLKGDYNVVIHIEKGFIEFKSSDCSDHICVKTGKLSRKSDVAICAPAKVMVSIENKEKTQIQTY